METKRRVTLAIVDTSQSAYYHRCSVPLQLHISSRRQVRKGSSMLGSPILDLALGMAFVYLLLSLIATVVQEILATITQARSANLRRGLHSLFSGDPLEFMADGTPGKLFVDALYQHGLVRGLYQDPEQDSKGAVRQVKSFQNRLALRLRRWLNIVPPGSAEQPADLLLPAYIPARTFSLALMDLLDDPSYGHDTLGNIESHLRAIQSRNQAAIAAEVANPTPQGIVKNAAAYENKAAEALLSLLINSEGKVDRFQSNLADWYNDSMDRASGWYKRYVQRILLCIGLLIAVFFNVDSVRVTRTLWFDHDARQSLASAADAYMKDHPNPPPPTPGSLVPPHAPVTLTDDTASASNSVPARSFSAKDLQSRLQDTVTTLDKVDQNNMLPVGWRHPFSEYHAAFSANPWPSLGTLLVALVGWMITAAALSLGAPFWFDMLNKIMVVRGTVKPSEKSPNEASKS